MLSLQLPLVAVTQGGTLTGALWLEPGFDTVAALQLELHLPAHAFTQVVLQRGAGLRAGDTQEPFTAPSAAGVSTVVIVPAQALAGPAELITFSAKVIARRGGDALLRARLISGADTDLTPFDPELVEGSVLVASGAPGVSTTALERGHRQHTYHGILIGEGGEPPYRWRVASGALPPGLALSSSGQLSGTPSAVGSYRANFEVADATSPQPRIASRSLTIDITEPLPEIRTQKLAVAAPGHFYDSPLAATGGLAPLRWSAQGLPQGLAIVGDRIAGIAADTPDFGPRTIVLTVEDATLPQLSTTKTLTLDLWPALAVGTVSVPGARDVFVAPNLLEVEYELDVDVTATVARGPGIAETREIIGRALEEVITAIVSTDCLDGPSLPDLRPEAPLDDPRGFGPPGRRRQPEPEARLGCRDRLLPLLDEYRNLRNARREAKVIFAALTVSVDGVPVFTHTEGRDDRRATSRSPIAHGAKSAATTALHAALDVRRAPLLKHARAQIESLISEAQAARKNGGVAAKKKGDKRKHKKWAPGDRVEALIDQRFEALRDLVLGFDWEPPRSRSGGPVLTLTTGPHEITLSAFATFIVAPGSVIGAAQASSATIIGKVTFRPRNPARWPRLNAEVSCQSVGASTSFQVDLNSSDADILVTTPAGVMLVPATGDPSAPYGAPRSFYSGAPPEHLHAGPTDEFGRTWVFCSLGDRLTIIRNQGNGGFAAPYRTAPSAAGTIRGIDLFDPRRTHQSVLLLHSRHVSCLSWLDTFARQGSAPVVVASPLTPDVLNDSATAFCRVPAPDGATDRGLVVTWENSGLMTWCELNADGQVIGTQKVAPLDEIALRRGAAGIAAFTTPGQAHLMLIARESRELLAWTSGTGIPDAAEAVVTPLPSEPHALVPAFGLGAALILGPARQAFLQCGDATLPLDLRSGVTAIHARGLVLVLSRQSGEISIIERR
jgi:hypothetical protein